ncbi:hypothetical protein KIPB_005121 [Kipferlia bialata]|uniref:CCHC-type domain-containing protein n=1 Tax=Kipferlia bialata TaxID=797122 RepID=A0A9K3CWK4_9EUKA|nr:hypothetical protein KIPB_005121 [Kipferlia bialata]|eukprot:g5121.t1
MAQYGIDNVRGGSFTQERLTAAEREVLTKEIATATDRCFYCHERGHIGANCPNNGGKAPMTRSRQSKGASRGKAVECERCGRNHPTSKCYASTDIDGHDISTSESESEGVCQRCGRDHPTHSCYARSHVDGHPLPSTPKRSQAQGSQGDRGASEQGGVCMRCGRRHRTAGPCRYTTHKDGSRLDVEMSCTTTSNKPSVPDCERCGRAHKTRPCVYKTHKDGRSLVPVAQRPSPYPVPTPTWGTQPQVVPVVHGSQTQVVSYTQQVTVAQAGYAHPMTMQPMPTNPYGSQGMAGMSHSMMQVQGTVPVGTLQLGQQGVPQYGSVVPAQLVGPATVPVYAAPVNVNPYARGQAVVAAPSQYGQATYTRVQAHAQQISQIVPSPTAATPVAQPTPTPTSGKKAKKPWCTKCRRAGHWISQCRS